MALALADEPLALFALRGYLDDLVIDHTVGQRHGGEEREQVGADGIAVDGFGLHGTDQRRQVYHVDVDQRKALYDFVAHPQTLIGAFQIGHAKRPLPEVEGHEAVQVFVCLLSVQ